MYIRINGTPSIVALKHVAHLHPLSAFHGPISSPWHAGRAATRGMHVVKHRFDLPGTDGLRASCRKSCSSRSIVTSGRTSPVRSRLLLDLFSTRPSPVRAFSPLDLFASSNTSRSINFSTRPPPVRSFPLLDHLSFDPFFCSIRSSARPLPFDHFFYSTTFPHPFERLVGTPLYVGRVYFDTIT